MRLQEIIETLAQKTSQAGDIAVRVSDESSMELLHRRYGAADEFTAPLCRSPEAVPVFSGHDGTSAVPPCGVHLRWVLGLKRPTAPPEEASQLGKRRWRSYSGIRWFDGVAT